MHQSYQSSKRMPVKTARTSCVQRPAAYFRYNMVREEILRAPGGREALLHGIPDVLLELPSFDMAKIGSILQVGCSDACTCLSSTL